MTEHLESTYIIKMNRIYLAPASPDSFRGRRFWLHIVTCCFLLLTGIKPASATEDNTPPSAAPQATERSNVPAGSLAMAQAPRFALKTNALYWATTTPNLGAELRLSRHFTLECEFGLNPFKHKRDDGSYGQSFRHLRIHPELRYYFCEAFYKHFLGLHVPYVNYNISDISLLNCDAKRKQGWGAGLGLSYGYDFAFSPHWNLEGTIGAGWLRLNHKSYPCANCGTVRSHDKNNYFGITQAGLTLSYIF